MDESLMKEVGAMLERGEFGAFAWPATLTGHGKRLCVLLYPQSSRAGARTKQLAETLGLVDIYADPVEVSDVHAVFGGETMALTTPHWSVVLAKPNDRDDSDAAVAVDPDSGRGLLIVGHGKGWAEWTRTDEGIVRFLDRQKRASASHGWIPTTHDGR
ncbi:hypothetical protein [Nocardia farcinica]|uniref:hypothetical protein n=1 Tax=Nocardia farcinica TaxID=37329 RepID=UPI003797F752